MPTLVTIKNIGRQTENFNGFSVAIGGTLVVDLDDEVVRKELRNDPDFAILPDSAAGTLPSGGTVVDATITAGAQVGQNRDITIQFVDDAADPIAETRAVQWFITNAAGDTVYFDGVQFNNVALAVGLALDVQANFAIAQYLTDANGLTTFTIQPGAPETLKINVILPDLSVVQQDVVWA